MPSEPMRNEMGASTNPFQLGVARLVRVADSLHAVVELRSYIASESPDIGVHGVEERKRAKIAAALGQRFAL